MFTSLFCAGSREGTVFLDARKVKRGMEGMPSLIKISSPKKAVQQNFCNE